jgi:hypothetical protein
MWYASRLRGSHPAGLLRVENPGLDSTIDHDDRVGDTNASQVTLALFGPHVPQETWYKTICFFQHWWLRLKHTLYLGIALWHYCPVGHTIGEAQGKHKVLLDLSMGQPKPTTQRASTLGYSKSRQEVKFHTLEDIFDQLLLMPPCGAGAQLFVVDRITYASGSFALKQDNQIQLKIISMKLI